MINMPFPNITRNQCKKIRDLKLKKHRILQGLFVVEGLKSVQELLKSDYSTVTLVATPVVLQKIEKQVLEHFPTYLAEKKTISSIGSLQNNEGILAVAKCKNNQEPIITTTSRLLILDDIQNPSNLGALMRIADWYDLGGIIASTHSVDFYNPKVIQASMGSFTRTDIYYTSLPEYLKKMKLPLIGATLNGNNMHKMKLPKSGALLVGNESVGIRSSLYPYLLHQVTIPRYGRAESLNVAVATGIICDYWFKTIM